MRNYYSDYVGHMMRQYLKLKDEQSEEINETTSINIRVCAECLQKMPETERAILLSVYSTTPLKEGVLLASEKQNIREISVWAIVKNFEKEAAIERGLI